MERGLPIPTTAGDTAAFWTGGHAGRLLITTCEDCGHRAHPPHPRCRSCFSERVAPAPVSGRATVYSFTINRQAWSAGLEVPYVIAVVELDEQPGLRLLTNIVGCPVEAVAIGDAVEVAFIARGAASVPVFRRVAG